MYFAIGEREIQSFASFLKFIWFTQGLSDFTIAYHAQHTKIITALVIPFGLKHFYPT